MSQADSLFSFSIFSVVRSFFLPLYAVSYSFSYFCFRPYPFSLSLSLCLLCTFLSDTSSLFITLSPHFLPFPFPAFSVFLPYVLYLSVSKLSSSRFVSTFRSSFFHPILHIFFYSLSILMYSISFFPYFSSLFQSDSFPLMARFCAVVIFKCVSE